MFNFVGRNPEERYLILNYALLSSLVFLTLQGCNEENSKQEIQVQKKTCPISELKYYEAGKDSLVIGEIVGWYPPEKREELAMLEFATTISQINLDFIYVNVDTSNTEGFDSKKTKVGACLQLKYNVEANGDENIFWSRRMKYINLTN